MLVRVKVLLVSERVGIDYLLLVCIGEHSLGLQSELLWSCWSEQRN